MATQTHYEEYDEDGNMIAEWYQLEPPHPCQKCHGKLNIKTYHLHDEGTKLTRKKKNTLPFTWSKCPICFPEDVAATQDLFSEYNDIMKKAKKQAKTKNEQETTKLTRKRKLQISLYN